MPGFATTILITLLGIVVFFLLLLHRVSERANVVDWGTPFRNRLDGLNRLFCRYVHRLDPEPLHIPATGPALVACNHVSGVDAMLLMAASKRPLRFIIAAEEYYRFGFNWLFRAAGCIPVERGTRPERAFREALRALQAGEVVALFPHGKIHLDDAPYRPLKGGVFKLSRLAQCPIVPARITGVRMQGKVMPAVFVPSRAHVHSYEPLDCAALEQRVCLEQLERIISGKRATAAQQ